MKPVYADLHIHVGKAGGHWVKIPTSKHLTVAAILEEAAQRKGLNLVGIVDVLSPWVEADWLQLEQTGRLRLLPGGGYRFDESLTILPGAEIETAELGGGLAHTLFFLPDLEGMRQFRRQLAPHIRNLHLSSQNAHLPLAALLELARPLEPLIIPAHVFTPHKSLFGSCTDRLSRLLPEAMLDWIDALELGLSADTLLADRLEELQSFTYLSNSDAHSLDKIAREYTVLALESVDFTSLRRALRRQGSDRILANYGLDPRLGKYHRTVCAKCNAPWEHGACSAACGSQRSIRGVLERIESLASWAEPRYPGHRPPYHHHIPLSFVPGLGPKGKQLLLDAFGSEMAVWHDADRDALVRVLGERRAAALWQVRHGNIHVAQGGGGCYGRVRLA